MAYSKNNNIASSCPIIRGLSSTERVAVNSAVGSQSITVSKKATPYLVIENASDGQLCNMVFLVACVLADDRDSKRNIISGICTLFAFFDKTTLTNVDVCRSFSEYGCDIYPVVIYSLEDLVRKVKLSTTYIENTLLFILGRYGNVLLEPLKGPILTSKHDSEKFRRLYFWQCNPNFIMAVCGAIYLMMFKKSPEKGSHCIWTQKIWREFFVAAGLGNPHACPDETILPNYKSCKFINSAFHACFEARRIMFKTILERANADVPDCWSSVWLTICSLAEFTELEHINIISNYMLDQNLKITAHPVFKEEFQLLLDAFSSISHMDLRVVPHFKIFRRDEITKKFDEIHFQKLLYVALRFGCTFDPNLRGYEYKYFGDCNVVDDETISRVMDSRIVGEDAIMLCVQSLRRVEHILSAFSKIETLKFL